MTTTAPATQPDVAQDAATRAFSLSMLISAIRCTMTYVVFPWILPIFGVAQGIGPGLGLAVGVVALASNVASIRRFHRSRHHWRWQVTALNVAVIVLVSILVAQDVGELLS